MQAFCKKSFDTYKSRDAARRVGGDLDIDVKNMRQLFYSVIGKSNRQSITKRFIAVLQ
jgi:hypothetical protein